MILKKYFLSDRYVFYFKNLLPCMSDLSSDEKTLLVQYGIKKYENEEVIIEKLLTVLSEKDIQRNIDTLIGTQRVRRIGPDVLQNNESHTELPELPENLKSIMDDL